MTAVELSNALTARWAAAEASAALSGACLFPLLAYLAAAAEGDEIASALGVERDAAAAAADELLAVLRASAAVRAAIGVWLAEVIEPTSWWRETVPVWERLRDQATLDAWAREHTGGLIATLPARVDDETLMLLAAALYVRTHWLEPFTPTEVKFEHRWVAGVTRASADLEAARLLDGAVTVVSVHGEDDVTVDLALGDGPPAAALATLLRGGRTAPLAEGSPGVTLGHWSPVDEPRLFVTLPGFTVTCAHDLLEHAALFGLEQARDPSRGHFPGLSDFPLAVQAATQAVTAAFTAEGFEAAALTVVAMVGGGMPRNGRSVSVAFDRPFAYAARLRSSGLVLVAGCVSEP